MNKKEIKPLKILRWIILSVILAGTLLLHYLHIKLGVKYPSVHAVCPFGGLENLWAWLAGRANLQKIFSGTMVLFFLTIVFAFIFRRSFCGNICPFGALQELSGRIFPVKWQVPRFLDKYLRYLKYIVLVLTAVMAWFTATLWFSPYDPWAALAHISTGQEVFNEFTIGIILLLLIFLVSFFINRSFCRYLCPAGALYALVSKLSPLKLNRDSRKCTDCALCSRVCPVDIEVHKLEKITTPECITCGLCIDTCPKHGVITFTGAGKLKIKPLLFFIFSVAVFSGSLFILDITGLYRVSLPSPVEIGEKQNYIGIADLRGSMTIEQGAYYTGKPLGQFYRIMEIPSRVPGETLLKNVQLYVPGYDFHVMKAKKAFE